MKPQHSHLQKYHLIFKADLVRKILIAKAQSDVDLYMQTQILHLHNKTNLIFIYNFLIEWPEIAKILNSFASQQILNLFEFYLPSVAVTN